MTMVTSSLRVVILGAASGIAEATARLYAAEGATLLLAGRRADRLDAIAADLKVRGAAGVHTSVLDLVTAEPRVALEQMAATLGGGRIDHIVLAYGTLGDQQRAERDERTALDIIDVNFRSAAAWSLAAADLLEKQGSGALVVLGSVAGDRGRRVNYVYGAAKAGLGVLVQGIAHRFAGKGPRVVLIKPGPTATAMTAGFAKQAKMASPEAVAGIVRRAADRGGPIVYAPGRWRLIMLVVRSIPAFVFNKLNF